MIVNFYVHGRLGNAIFRYLASVILCLHFNGTYTVDSPQSNKCSDEMFLNIVENIINKREILPIPDGINMDRYYQHDLIYKIHKNEIIDFINNHTEHYVVTDGINPADGNCQKYFMRDILNTPLTFDKKYTNVLHIRLEDFVILDWYVKVERIIELLKRNIISESLCLVCNKPVSDFENAYIQVIKDYISTTNLQLFIEHNDTITDFYIMKEAETLICSKSTLSWSAAFFSNKINKCYLPDYDISPNSTCKYPIDNTELY